VRGCDGFGGDVGAVAEGSGDASGAGSGGVRFLRADGLSVSDVRDDDGVFACGSR